MTQQLAAELLDLLMDGLREHGLSFIKTKEKGFEALVLADVMTEFARVYGGDWGKTNT